MKINISFIVLFLILIHYTSFSKDILKINVDTLNERPPRYPGGIDSFREYIINNIRYPIIPQIEGINFGKVQATFVIDSTGNLIKPKIQRGLNKSFNTQILDLLLKSEKWTPGSIKGINKNVIFRLPIRIFPPEFDLKGANTIINGEFIPAKKIKNKLQDNYIPYYSYNNEFSIALFGPKYNKPLVIIYTNSQLSKSPKDLKITLSKLKNIDTTKFNLYIDNKLEKFDVWHNYLNGEKVANLNISKYDAGSNKIGQVILYTHEGFDEMKTQYYKQIAQKQSFLDLIYRHRNIEKIKTDMLIYVDDYPFQTNWLLDSMNTNIISYLTKTTQEEAKKRYTDYRKNGYYQIYTSEFSHLQQTNFRDTLTRIINDYQLGLKTSKNYHFFINNLRSNIEEFVELGLNNMSLIHIISKQRAKDLFGKMEDKAIIYVFTK